jgi:adenylylsulfate kinase-like enzyme
MDGPTAVEPPVVREADAPTYVHSTASSSGATTKKKPTVIIVLGMAGTGKTTLMQRLNSHLHQVGLLPPPARG